MLQTVVKKAAPKAAPKASVKPKSAAVKPAPKAKAAPKKKVLVDHDNNVEESGSDFEFDKAPSDDEPKASTSNLQPERKKKTASETYTKVRL